MAVFHPPGYEILGEIGRGGMGVVYKARQTSLHRLVAIKTLPAVLVQDEEAFQRFQREARAAASLDHPHVITIHDFGVADGVPYLVMAYVDGPNLHQRIRRDGPLVIADAVEVIARLAEALDLAHRRDIVHRDIKSANVLLPAPHHPVLTDFGIARASNWTTLTRTGAFMGTPAYMSPEQLNGQPPDGRSDLYSLGVVLYECLTGKLPYSGETTMQILYQVVQDARTPIQEHRPDVPSWLDEIVERCLARDAVDRYADGAALVAALRTGENGAKTISLKGLSDNSGDLETKRSKKTEVSSHARQDDLQLKAFGNQGKLPLHRTSIAEPTSLPPERESEVTAVPIHFPINRFRMWIGVFVAAGLIVSLIVSNQLLQTEVPREINLGLNSDTSLGDDSLAIRDPESGRYRSGIIITPERFDSRSEFGADLDELSSTELEEDPGSQNRDQTLNNDSYLDLLGLSLTNLSPSLLQQFGIEIADDIKGVLIAEVDPTSLAYRESELRRGYIITEIDRQEVRNIIDVLAIYGGIDKGESFLVRVLRPVGDDSRPMITAMTRPE